MYAHDIADYERGMERDEHEDKQQDTRRRRRISEQHLDRNSEYSWHREIDHLQHPTDFDSREKRIHRSTRRVSDDAITDKMLDNNNNYYYSRREFDSVPSRSSRRYSSAGGNGSSTCEPSSVSVNSNSAHVNLEFNAMKTNDSTRRGQYGEQQSGVSFGAYLERFAGNNDTGVHRQTAHKSDHRGKEENRNLTDCRDIYGGENIRSNSKFDSAFSKFLQNETASVSDSEQGEVDEITVTELIYDTDDQWTDAGGGGGEVDAEDNWDDNRPRIQVNHGCSLSIQVPAKRFHFVSSTDHGASSGTGYRDTGETKKTVTTTFEKVLKRQESGFGFALTFERKKSENESNLDMLPLFESVVPGGAAELAGIFPGDRLLEVNGQSASGLSSFFCRKLFENQGEVAIKLVRSKEEIREKDEKLNGISENESGTPNSSDSRIACKDGDQVNKIRQLRTELHRSTFVSNDPKSRNNSSSTGTHGEKHRQREEIRRLSAEPELKIDLITNEKSAVTGWRCEDGYELGHGMRRNSRADRDRMSGGRNSRDGGDRSRISENKNRHEKSVSRERRKLRERRILNARQTDDDKIQHENQRRRNNTDTDNYRGFSFEGDPADIRRSSPETRRPIRRQVSAENSGRNGREIESIRKEREFLESVSTQNVEHIARQNRGENEANKQNYWRSRNRSTDSSSYLLKSIIGTADDLSRTFESSDFCDLSAPTALKASKAVNINSDSKSVLESSFPAGKTCIIGNFDPDASKIRLPTGALPFLNEPIITQEHSTTAKERSELPSSQGSECQDADRVVSGDETEKSYIESADRMIIIAPPTDFSDNQKTDIVAAPLKNAVKYDGKPVTLPKPDRLITGPKTQTDDDYCAPFVKNSDDEKENFISIAERLRKLYLNKVSESAPCETLPATRYGSNSSSKEDGYSNCHEFLPAPPGFSDSVSNLDSGVETTKENTGQTDAAADSVTVTSTCDFQSIPILSWTPNDVADWLESQKLGEHRERFLKQSIDGVRLTQLERSSLIGLGMTNALHRLHFERALLKLQFNVLNL